MNKYITTAIFSCIASVLLSSGLVLKQRESVVPVISTSEFEHDTTGYTGLIKVDSFHLAIIPPASGIQFYKNNSLVFLSLSKNESKMLPDHLSFGTIEAYYAVQYDSVLGQHHIFSQWPSFSYPSESLAFTYDFNTMYFSGFSEKDKKEKIYMAKLVSTDKNVSGWQSDNLPLDFCTGNSTYSHPALSIDGQILIFASDREGSIGGMDLFISRKNGANWSAPENLGSNINTAGNEFFPSIDKDNNLFFSSDGLPGYGGYDVFTSKFNGEAWEKPINLSPVINSSNDDISFTINKNDGKTAFYTRRQKNEKDEMQLFRVTLKEDAAESDLITISSVFNGMNEYRRGLESEKIITVVKPDEKEPVIPESPVASTETIKKDSSEMVENSNIAVYRVQFISSTTSKGKFQISVLNISYDTYEYYYKQAYRYTIGEFDSLSKATELQNTCRKSGYPQAFVVAFKNNIRSLDPQLFK